MLGVALVCMAGAAPAWAVDSIDNMPPGEGRELTFAWCTACHGVKILLQQGMSAPRWDEKVQEMIDKNGMKLYDAQVRATIVAYLAKAFPERRARSTNPFQ
ncbi:MAG TPA: hypothetical protein VF678_07260 [bacterium]